MNSWYHELKKPTWAPPAKWFGPVWSILYLVIMISFGYIGFLFYQEDIPWIILMPFVLNLFFNIAFTPIQFQCRNNELALLDIIAVLVTLLWSLLVIYPYASWVTLVNIPYFLWVSFATILQFSITSLNQSLHINGNL